jgi:hypothetical protein
MTQSSDDQQRTQRPPFLDYLVPGRECGDCTACCKLIKIDWPELRKPAGVLCHHNTGSGCGIHASRPDGCRRWFCLWRRLDAMPEHARPDRARVMFSAEMHYGQLYIVARAFDDPADFQTGVAKTILDRFVEDGTLPIWTVFGEASTLHYPAFPLADAITRPSATPWQSLVVDALIWRNRHGWQ